MISYNDFLNMDHEQRSECLYEHGRFVTAGTGPGSFEAYFLVHDFFVNVQVAQQDFKILDLRPIRDGRELSFLFYLLDTADQKPADPTKELVCAYFDDWCCPDQELKN